MDEKHAPPPVDVTAEPDCTHWVRRKIDGVDVDWHSDEREENHDVLHA